MAGRLQQAHARDILSVDFAHELPPGCRRASAPAPPDDPLCGREWTRRTNSISRQRSRPASTHEHAIERERAVAARAPAPVGQIGEIGRPLPTPIGARQASLGDGESSVLPNCPQDKRRARGCTADPARPSIRCPPASGDASIRRTRSRHFAHPAKVRSAAGQLSLAPPQTTSIRHFSRQRRALQTAATPV